MGVFTTFFKYLLAGKVYEWATGSKKRKQLQAKQFQTEQRWREKDRQLNAIDEQIRPLQRQIDAQRAHYDDLDSEFDSLQERIDALERLGGHEEEIAALDARQDEVFSEMSEFEDKEDMLDDLEDKRAGIEDPIFDLDYDIDEADIFDDPDFDHDDY
jgi:chromosome segregation ATPase